MVDETGLCSVCGKWATFHYCEVLPRGSQVVVSCGFDETFRKEVNIKNSLKCEYCGAIFRVRCVASSLLKYCTNGSLNSVHEFAKHMQSGSRPCAILETVTSGGVLSHIGDLPLIVKTEYFDDVPFGGSKNGVPSEDLQNLTFGSDTFDVVIALDVFEHIADPWKAFAEIRRVIKPYGVGLITIPLDTRKKRTTTFARMEGGKVIHYRVPPAYHFDPLRTQGALVFTEFGVDVVDCLRTSGYRVDVDVYWARSARMPQLVLVIHK